METGNLMIDAQSAFSREQRRRRRARALGWLTRRPNSGLASLDAALQAGAPAARRSTGLHPIPVESIVGTAEQAKTRTFDRRFRPGAVSRGRWERLWMAGRRGASLPPISVYRLGDEHFVRDGHHRVSVARSLGMAAIDAEVTDLGVVV
jgi:ParB-like chromosome segregation protein Spo0J